MGTAPQRSASRRWTVRGLVVVALAVPALVAGINTANAAELPPLELPHVADAPGVDPHMVDADTLDKALAEHDLHGATDKKAEKSDKKDSAKKSEKKSDKD